MWRIDIVVRALVIACIAGYGLAAVLLQLRRRRSGRVLFAAAWLMNGVLILLNWAVGGHPPFANMYHVLTFLAFCSLPFWLILALRDRLAWLDVYFAAAAVVALTGTLFMARSLMWRRMPALQSPWFVPHVVSYMVSYALAAVAFAVMLKARSCRYVCRRPGSSGEDDAAVHQLLRLAFPFMTFGLLSGALWADAAWGAYWSWDPKETWALITWTLYALFFHCRKEPHLRRYAGLAHVLAFLCLLVTFLLVNLLPKLSSPLHSYT